MHTTIISVAIAVLAVGIARSQEYTPLLDSAYGTDATQWVDETYIVTPTNGLTDQEAAQRLTRLANTESFSPGTTIVLHNQNEEPIIRSTTNDAGRTRFEWLAFAPLMTTAQAARLASISPAVVALLDDIFGEGSTEWRNGVYHVSPRISIVPVVAVRELSQLMNSNAMPINTSIRLQHDGQPLVSGIKDEAGEVTLRSLMPRPARGASAPARTLAPHSGGPAATRGSTNSWGATCTTYERGSTSGLRCRDSTGHTWGSECTSYQTGNTFGVRCRDW